jgi:hypothetical protein
MKLSSNNAQDVQDYAKMIEEYGWEDAAWRLLSRSQEIQQLKSMVVELTDALNVSSTTVYQQSKHIEWLKDHNSELLACIEMLRLEILSLRGENS